MPNVAPSLDTDNDEISPGTRPDQMRDVAEPKFHRRLSDATVYTLSKNSASSSGDSSVPRRLVRAIPDLRMFKFIRKMSYERKLNEQKKVEEQAENARRDREADKKKRKAQFRNSTNATISANRPDCIRLPDKPNMLSVPHETLDLSAARTPFKEISGFFKSFGEKARKESSPSSHISSDQQRRNSSKSNTDNSKAGPQTSIATNATPLSQEASDFSNVHDERQPEGASILPRPDESHLPGTYVHPPRPKLVRMSITPFRRQSQQEEDESDTRLSSRSVASSARTLGSGAEGIDFETMPPSTGGDSTKKSKFSLPLKQSDSSMARKRRFCSEPGTPDSCTVHTCIRKGGVCSDEGTSAPTTPHYEEQERDTPPSGTPSYTLAASAYPPQQAKRRRGKFRGYFFEHSTPDGSDDSPPTSMPWDPFWRKSNNDAALALAPEARQSTHKDWYQVRLDNILDDDPDRLLEDAGAVKDVPDHLPGSPLCPRDPKHSSGGTGMCPFHGKRTETRKHTLSFV